MEMSTLKLFIEVIHRGSFTEVANTRRVAPSSVSRAIAALESELGFRLFQRSTRKLQPTEAGLLYFERVQALVDELDSARELAADINEEPRGRLRVTAPTVFGQMYLVPLLPELHAAYPKMSIELLLNDAYIDLIDERIDVAIRLGSLPDSNHVARRLRAMRFHICASPEFIERHGKPSTPKEVGQFECLLFPRGEHNLNWLFKNADGHIEEVTIKGRCLITHSDAIRQCAVNGMGLALLPDWLIQEDIRDGTLIPLFEEFEVSATDYQSAVWLLRPSREYSPLKVRIFSELLNTHLADT
jgi:DNA-binding transcriptional LysR family regulator